MDIQQQKRPHLEPIQEESEQEDEDEAEKSRTSEDEDESFQIRAGAETEVTGAEEESEEDGDELRVMRLWRRRRSSSQSHGSLPQMQFSSSEQAESENLSPPAQNSDSAALSDEGKQERPRKEKWSISRQLRLKMSKIERWKHKPRKAAAPRKKPREAQRAELFPEWLVDLMVNIEEATTHQLVVE